VADSRVDVDDLQAEVRFAFVDADDGLVGRHPVAEETRGGRRRRGDWGGEKQEQAQERNGSPRVPRRTFRE
jgi:hypothetical protein